MDTPKETDVAQGEVANIGKSLTIKGDLSGSEDLYIDGQIEGSIEMKGNRLTIGPNGRVKANVSARTAVIQGNLQGNVVATERVDLKQSAIVLGDIATQRISIEEGAYFKGGIDIQREGSKAEATAPTAAAASAPAASVTGLPSGAEPRK